MGRSSIFSVLCVFSIAGGLSFTLATTIASFPCGGNITSHYARIKSPNYPSSYDNNLRCIWTIDRSWDSEILLRIRYFSTEQCCDKLRIMDKNLGKYIADLKGHCYVRGDRWFSTSSNHIELYFETDGSVVNTGFDIIIESHNISKYNFAQTTVPPTKGIVCENLGAFNSTTSTQRTTTYNLITRKTSTTNPATHYWTKSYPTTISTIGYSNVRIEYGTYGRVFIHGREICDVGLTYQIGEALCHSKGYPYSSFNSVSPRSHYNTYIIQCSSSYINDCYIRDNGYCSRALYLNCQEISSASSTTTIAVTTTTPYWTRSTVGFSNVQIEYGTYGRVYIHGREVCYESLSYQAGEALCQSKGYSFGSFNSVSPRSHYNAYIIQCSSSYINDCYIRDNSYCSRALYLYCQEISSSSSTKKTTIARTTTTPYWTRSTVGYSNVQIENGTYGRVYIHGLEVCYESLSYQAGEALCQSKGYSFSSFNSVSPRSHYNTNIIQCSSSYINDCYIRDNSYCSRALYLHCQGNSTAPPVASTTATTTRKYWTATKTSTRNSITHYWVGTSRTAGYSDVQIENGTYGRVYINGREVCYEGLTYQSGEALCQSKGYSYRSFHSDFPRNDYHIMYRIQCFSIYLKDCNIQDHSPCSSVLYLNCFSSTISFYTTKTTPRYWTTRKTTPTETTTLYWKTTKGLTGTVGYSDVQIEYGTHGRMLINGREVCYEGLTYLAKEALCQSKGYSYSTSNGVSSRSYYNTYEFHCSSSNIYWCYTRDRNYCSSVLYIYCYRNGSTTNFKTTTTTSETTHIRTKNPTRKVTTPYYWKTTEGQTGIRLVGSGYPWKGTIEIRHNGQWGTICDDSFDKKDGDVICRMLGYTHSSQTYQNAHYGQGSGPIWLDDLGCNGYESDVTYCSSGGWGSHNCGHSEDAGVDCENSATKEYDTTTYDPCNGYQCYNGGTCIFQNNGYPGYYCVCPNGYTGTNCYYETTTYDPCYGYPCRHGGTCYRNYGYPGYYCACANGYTGQHCDVSAGFSPENAVSVGCMDSTWDISVYLSPLYNRYTDFDPSDLYLGTDSCTGYVNGNYLHFRSDYSACDTVTKTLTDNIVHTNQLVYALHDPNHHYIVHEYRFRVPVDCYMTRNEEGSGHFNHGHDITIPAAHHVTGSSHHSVRLQFYTDSTFRYTKPLHGSRAGDTVYVRAYTETRDYTLKMRISDCFTTPTSSSFSSLKYFIIQNGCVIDPNARILSQTTHETRFYFQDFEYSTNRDSLYLHCNATFCKSNDYSDACEQTCHHARKRVGGGNIVYGGPVDSMTVNEAVRLTKADDTRSSNSRRNSNMIAVLSVILGIILITLVTFMVIGKVKKNRQKKSQIV